jgi:transposase
MKIINTILANPDGPVELESLIHGSLKKKLPELSLAVDGIFSPEQAGKIRVIMNHLDNLKTRKDELELLIYQIAVPYSAQIDLILTTPGIRSTLSAIKIISEIGVNMEVFPSAKHLCSWAGLTPTNNESAGKKKSVRVSKAGCYIKPLLVQCATAVVKSEKHPEIRNRYLRLKKRRGHKKAIIAIARMLLTALYNMLKNNEVYNAELYKKSDILPIDREISIEQAILIAKQQGYRIKSAS